MRILPSLFNFSGTPLAIDVIGIQMMCKIAHPAKNMFSSFEMIENNLSSAPADYLIRIYECRRIFIVSIKLSSEEG